MTKYDRAAPSSGKNNSVYTRIRTFSGHTLHILCFCYHIIFNLLALKLLIIKSMKMLVKFWMLSAQSTTLCLGQKVLNKKVKDLSSFINIRGLLDYTKRKLTRKDTIIIQDTIPWPSHGVEPVISVIFTTPLWVSKIGYTVYYVAIEKL